MIFDEIYQCALQQDAEKLKQILNPNSVEAHRFFASKLPQPEAKKRAIDETKPGKSFISPAAQLVLDGKKEAAEFLMNNGANISYVLIAAALANDKPYLEVLLKRPGAHIKYAVMGAAMLGHKNDAYVLSLIKRKADINFAVRGAALAGKFIYALEHLVPVRRGNINYAILGAAEGGHFKDVIKIYDQYAQEIEPRYIADGAILGGYISDNADTQLNYLPHFNTDRLPTLINAFRATNEQPINIHKSVEERIITMSQLMHVNQLSHAQALTKTDPKCQGMLYLLMLVKNYNLMVKNTKDEKNINDKHTALPCFPIEIWLHIFNFVTPVKLSNSEFNKLGEHKIYKNKVG